MPNEVFQAQIALLVRVLPYVAAETCFALKGASVVTSKAATCGHFKTGHFGWPRRDCFTVPQVVFARVRLSR
jgi:hypothetical protein